MATEVDQEQGPPVANRDQWLELQSLLQERRAPPEWIKVPSHTGLHGNEMADEPGRATAWRQAVGSGTADAEEASGLAQGQRKPPVAAP